MERGRLSVIACDSGRPFAERVVASLRELFAADPSPSGDCRLVRSEEVRFDNGEVKTVVHEPVRGDDVYVVQAVDDPLSHRSVNDNLMAAMTALNAAAQGDADHITAVLPQFPYSRQERKKTREGITAKQVARFLEISGAQRVITLDIHAPAIAGFFESARMDNLYASGPILAHLRKHYPVDNLVVVSPDVGSADRARFYSKALQTDMAMVDKERDYSRPSTIAQVRLVGEVAGHDVFMADDLIQTGGSILSAAALLKEKGARDVFLACSLPFLNGAAVERFRAAHAAGVFKTLIATDAVFRGERFLRDNPWYEEVTVAPLFARAVFQINRKRSVSQILD